MNVPYLYIVFALLVGDVTSECDHYIDCFTEFLSDLLGNSGDVKEVSVGNFSRRQFDLDEKKKTFDEIFEDLSVLIKQIGVGVRESITKKEENNNTKIYVKTFEFDNQSDITEEVTETTIATTADESNESTTDTISFPEILLDNANMLPFETTSQNINVIPLQNDKDNEITNKDDLYDTFDDLDDNSTDYPGIDYIELYKDTTNEFLDYAPTEPSITLGKAMMLNEKGIDELIEESLNLIQDDVLINLIKNITNGANRTVESCNGDKMVVSDAVFPWVATIFVKNESKGNQFDYFCDGALISNKLVLTAARCTYNGNVSFSPETFIVILGKTSLQTNSGEEKILRVKAIKRHENYTVTEGKATNDLAVLVLEETVGFVDGLATACLKSDEETIESEEDSKEAITTAWSFSGDLTLIYFDKEKSKACGQDNKVENTFCATYRNDVALCPSYGGLYVTISADNHLHLQGLRNGNPLDRGICYDRNVNYTSLKHYRKWIRDVIESNK